MKKMLIFGSIVVIIFILLAVVTNMQNKQQAEGNVYNKEMLHPETIKQLDDPIYQNLILEDELTTLLENKESAYIYFYSPTCSHCKTTSPVVVPMAEELGINLQLYNLLEFQDGWDTYLIEGTPTIVRFEKGKEVARIEGGVGITEDGKVDATRFEEWFAEVQK